MRTLSLFAIFALFLSIRALTQDPYYSNFIEKLGVEAHTTSEGKDCVQPIASAIYDFRDVLVYNSREVDTLVSSVVELIDKLKYEVSPECRSYYGDFGAFMVQYFGDIEDLRDTAMHNLEALLFEIDAAIREASMSLETGRDDLAGEKHAYILRQFLGLEKAENPAVPVDLKQLEQEILSVIEATAEKIEDAYQDVDPYPVIDELYDERIEDVAQLQEAIKEGLQVAGEIFAAATAAVQDQVVASDYLDVDQNDYIGYADEFADIPNLDSVNETQNAYEEIPVTYEPPSFDTQVDSDIYGYDMIEPEVPSGVEEPVQVISQRIELPYEAPVVQEQYEVVSYSNNDVIEAEPAYVEVNQNDYTGYADADADETQNTYDEVPVADEPRFDTQADYNGDIYGYEMIEPEVPTRVVEEPFQVENQYAEVYEAPVAVPAIQEQDEVVIYTNNDVIEADPAYLEVDQNDYIGYADEFADIPNLDSVNETQNAYEEVPVADEPPRFDSQIDYDADEIYGDEIIGQYEAPRIEEPVLPVATIPEHAPEVPKEVEYSDEAYEEPKGPGIRKRLLMEVPHPVSLDSRHGPTTSRFAKTDICFNSILDRFSL